MDDSFIKKMYGEEWTRFHFKLTMMLRFHEISMGNGNGDKLLNE